jgi:hypothetical protein
MIRTTVFLDETLIQRAKQLARDEGKSFAALVRDAVASYVAGNRGNAPGVPSVAGAFESKRSDISERTDGLLWTDPHS